MIMPGFTAEGSLYKTNQSYRGLAGQRVTPVLPSLLPLSRSFFRLRGASASIAAAPNATRLISSAICFAKPSLHLSIPFVGCNVTSAGGPRVGMSALVLLLLHVLSARVVDVVYAMRTAGALGAPQSVSHARWSNRPNFRQFLGQVFGRGKHEHAIIYRRSLALRDRRALQACIEVGRGRRFIDSGATAGLRSPDAPYPHSRFPLLSMHRRLASLLSAP